jgi:hypothetical protein
MTTPGAISTVGPSGGVAIVARVWSGTLAARPAWSRTKKKRYFIDSGAVARPSFSRASCFFWFVCFFKVLIGYIFYVR